MGTRALAALALLVGCTDAGQGTPSRTATTFLVAGEVVGLRGMGLVLQLDGEEELAIAAEGAFAFTTELGNGASYEVTVTVQPTAPDQTCVIDAPIGRIRGAPTALVVSCATERYTIGGTASGLSGTLTLGNLGTTLDVTGDGAFVFATSVADGAQYDVHVASAPAGQSCTVAGASGQVAGMDVTTVTVTCAAETYQVSGWVFDSNGPVTLQNNGGDDLVVANAGVFTFAMALPDGAPFDVTVAQAPPVQTCSVLGGTGTIGGASVADVVVSCTDTLGVSVLISGLTGSGFQMQNNMAETIAPTADGRWWFPTPRANGEPYDVTVLSQPTSPAQQCAIDGGIGTIGPVSVEVNVVCTDPIYRATAHVSAGASGTLCATGKPGCFNVPQPGDWPLPWEFRDQEMFDIYVDTPPFGAVCTVTGGTGTVNASDIDLDLDCQPGTLLQLNPTGLDGKGLTVDVNGSTFLVTQFSFGSPTLGLGQPYTLTIIAQPTNPRQTCSVTSGNATGVGTGSNITVDIDCVTDTFSVAGSVSGLAMGEQVTLDVNGVDSVAVGANGPFSFPTALPDRSQYTLSVQSHPSGQTCAVGNGAARLRGQDTSITVECSDHGVVGAITPLYATHGNWNAYVLNDGPSYTSPTDAACTTPLTRNSCLNGGEYWVATTSESTCTGLTARDVHDVLEWTCLDGSGNAVFYSTGMRPRARLSSLIDFVNATWHDNAVVVSQGGTPLGASVPGAWWTNPVSTVAGPGNISTAGVHIVTSALTTYPVITGDEVAFVVQPGLTLAPATGTFAVNNAMHVWVEGAFTQVDGSQVIHLNNADGAVLRGVDVTGKQFSNTDGVFILQSDAVRVEYTTAHGVNRFGFSVANSSEGTYRNAAAVREPLVAGTPSSTGFRISGASYDNVFITPQAVGNLVGVDCTEPAARTRYGGVVLADNLTGFRSTCIHDVVVGGLVVNNDQGVLLGSTSDTTVDPLLMNLTIANSATAGLEFATRSGVGLLAIGLAGANNATGLRFSKDVGTTIIDLASSGTPGVTITGSADNTVLGLLKVEGGCRVLGGLNLAPGLDPSCMPAGVSTTLTVNMTATFVGPVAEGQNLSGASVPNNQAISEWLTFENAERQWSRGAATDSPGAQRGRTDATSPAHVRDWSAATGDTGDGGAPVVRGVLGAPADGDDVVSHTWAISAPSTPACDAARPGSVHLVGDLCRSTFLRHAHELLGDGRGNDNGLCESNETCRYTPNIGSYQGHGSTTNLGVVGTGGETLLNIELLGYANNGRM